MLHRVQLGSAILVFVATSRTGLAEPAQPGEPEADDAIQVLPCRPTIACTAEIVRGGSLEVETGYAHRRAGDAAMNSALGLLKYSATDWLQIQLGSNNLVTAGGGSSQWLDGVFVGPKVVVVEQSAQVPAVSVSALFMVPTRSGPDAITQTTDGYFWAYASKDVFGFHADFNVGIDVLSLTAKPAVQVLTALSVSHDLAHGLGAMVEGYTYEGGAPYAAHDAGVLMALSFGPSPGIMFDLGGDVALHRDARSATLFRRRHLHPISHDASGARREPCARHQSLSRGNP